MESTAVLPGQPLALPIQQEAPPAQTEPSRLRRAVGVIGGIVFSTGLGAGLNYFMCRNHPNMLLGVLIGAVQGFTDATVGAIVDHWVENKKHAQIIKSVSTFVVATISIIGLTTLGMLTPTWAIVSGVFAAVIFAWGLYSAFHPPSTEEAAQEPQTLPTLELEDIDESDSKVEADDQSLKDGVVQKPETEVEVEGSRQLPEVPGAEWVLRDGDVPLLRVTQGQDQPTPVLQLDQIDELNSGVDKDNQSEERINLRGPEAEVESHSVRGSRQLPEIPGAEWVLRKGDVPLLKVTQKPDQPTAVDSQGPEAEESADQIVSDPLHPENEESKDQVFAKFFG